MANKSRDREREVMRSLLRKLRLEKGYTQVDLSDALSKHQSYVSKYENGERKLDYVELRAVCLVLGTSMEEFNEQYEGILSDKR